MTRAEAERRFEVLKRQLSAQRQKIKRLKANRTRKSRGQHCTGAPLPPHYSEPVTQIMLPRPPNGVPYQWLSGTDCVAVA